MSTLDPTLEFMRSEKMPLTLENYCAVNWDLEVADVLDCPESAAELPVPLLRKWLRSGDAEGVDAETLAWLEEIVEEDEE